MCDRVGDTKVKFKCATAVTLERSTREVHSGHFPVSACVLADRKNLRHLASTRLTCMHLHILHSMYTYIHLYNRNYTHTSCTDHKSQSSHESKNNIGSDHRMVMGSVTLNTRAERRKLLNKNTKHKTTRTMF